MAFQMRRAPSYSSSVERKTEPLRPVSKRSMAKAEAVMRLFPERFLCDRCCSRRHHGEGGPKNAKSKNSSYDEIISSTLAHAQSASTHRIAGLRGRGAAPEFYGCGKRTRCHAN